MSLKKNFNSYLLERYITSGLNHPWTKQAESLKKTVPAEAGVFIWYLNKVYSILNDPKIEKISKYI